MTSTQLVFTIPELLENILLQIPERDLLLSQRVNETFRDVIEHSPQLQRRLFFTADIYQEGDLLRAIKWNPLLDAFHPYRPSDAFMWRRDAYKPWEKWRNLNQNNQLSREDFADVCSPDIELEVLGKANYPTASWKKMYFTQPAVSKMTMDVKHPRFGNIGLPQFTHLSKNYSSNFAIAHYQKGEVSCVWESMLRLR